MTPRLRALLAVAVGAVGAFGQAPYDFAGVTLLALIAACALFAQAATARQAAVIGWAFGTGYFMHTLQWIVSPFLVDAARQGWMAPFALVLLSAGLALFWALAFWLAGRRGQGRLWALIVTWTLAEVLRAYVFTGFPWATPAQIIVNAANSAMLSYVGPHGVNLWLFGVAALTVNFWYQSKRGHVVAPVFGLSLASLITVPVQDRPTPLTEHTVRLIQPNAAQRDKWDPDKIPVFFNRQLEFTAAPAAQGGRAPDLVLWSETAIPWTLDFAGDALTQIAQAGGQSTVALGAQRRDDLRYFNSMVVLDRQGLPEQIYDKHHLVPFGEYMPLGDLLGRFGIHGLAARDGNGYSSGPGAKVLDFGPLGKVLPLICYEAVFAHDVGAAPERPAFLIQITNDAWFGKGAGPLQHLAQARMRAIEQGLPLARAANTGVSAMIDARGQVTASLPLNTSGFVDARLPAPRAPTLYSRTGDGPLTILLLIAMLPALFWRKKGRHLP